MTSSRREFLMGVAGSVVVAGNASPVAAQPEGEKMKLTGTDVLLVIDVQNCFIPGGSLAVKGGDEIVPLINRLAKGF